jgi:putative intracellular protease/amidase
MRLPLFVDRPTLRPPRCVPIRRVLVIFAPEEADIGSIKILGRILRRLGVEVVAASECHGEVCGEHGRPLLPNMLLIEAARSDWDAVVIAGGKGAMRVAEDAFAREVIARAASHGKPVAASGAGRIVLQRTGLSGFASLEPRELSRHLCDQLGLRDPGHQPLLHWLRERFS